MIKTKNLGIILDEHVYVSAVLQNGEQLKVCCVYIKADYDRLYLFFPEKYSDKVDYFSIDNDVIVHLKLIDGKRDYVAKVLNKPKNNLLVVEYYEGEVVTSDRKSFRVSAFLDIDVFHDNNWKQMKTLNLSATGCSIISDILLEIDKKYNATIHLDDFDIILNTVVQVLRIEKVKDSGKYKYGVTFVSNQDNIRDDLLKYCNKKQIKEIIPE